MAEEPAERDPWWRAPAFQVVSGYIITSALTISASAYNGGLGAALIAASLFAGVTTFVLLIAHYGGRQ